MFDILHLSNNASSSGDFSIHVMDKDLYFIFLFNKHSHTCGNDDYSGKQLLLKSGAYKYLITRNVRHTHSLLVPDEQLMLHFFSHHTPYM